MSDFTYEKGKTNLKLETFEWDNTWWEHTEDTETPRIIYIGDSISVGTRRLLNQVAEKRFLFDSFSTSKALDNPFYKDSLDLYMRQQGSAEGILFNNGLHGWHLNDEEYEKYFREMVEFLKDKKLPVYIVLTTNLPDDKERNDRVLRRNAIAENISSETGCNVIDLYSASLKCKGLYCGDGVHFKEDGYEILARTILESLS